MPLGAFRGTMLAPFTVPVIPLFDDFNRPNSASLGVTSVGEREWSQTLGVWSITSNRAQSSTADAAAVVESFTPNVDIKLDVAAGGRDAIVFRATDANNFWMLARYRDVTTSTSCTPVTKLRVFCCNQQDNFVVSFDGCGFCPSCSSFIGQGTDGTTCTGFTQCASSPVQNCPDSCTTTTTTTNRIYLIKREAGTFTNVNFYTVASGFTQLRVEAEGDDITVYTSDVATQTVTGQTFNNEATLHGIGRRNLGNQSATAIDNFDLTPVTA